MSGPQTHIGARGPQRTNTGPAAEANRQFGAERAAKDPKRLDKSLRVVKTAVALETLTLADLIRETVDQMPPLTAAERRDLAALLLDARRDEAAVA